MMQKPLLKLLLVIFLINIIITSVTATTILTEKTNLEICQCAKLTDSLFIKNNGLYSAKYTISTNQEFLTLSPKSFELYPGEQITIPVLFNIPCDNKGVYNVDFIVSSTLGEQKLLRKEVTIGKCQNLNAQLYFKNETLNPCTQIDYTISVENTGVFTEEYEISATNEEFVNISKPKIILKPSEKQSIKVTLNPSCDLYGSQEQTFFITALKNNLQTELKHDFVINQYYEYSVKVNDEYDVCEETGKTIFVKISNDVEVPNEYVISLENKPAFVKLTERKIFLDKYESGIVNITINPKEGKDLGEYVVQLNIKSLYGDIYYSKNISLNVSNCYDLEIIMPEKKTFCAGINELPVIIKNKGVFSEDIELLTSDNAYFKNEMVTFNSGEEKELMLVVEVPEENNAFEVFVEAKLNNEVSAYDNTKIKPYATAKCYYVTTNPKTLRIRAHKETGELLKIKNKGVVAGDFKLLLDADSWMGLNQTSVYLEPRETKTIWLQSNHESKTTLGKHPVNLTIEHSEFAYKKNLVVKLQGVSITENLYKYYKENPCQLATTILILFFVITLLFLIFSKKKAGKIKLKPFIIALIIIIILLAATTFMVYKYKGLPYIQEPIDYSSQGPLIHIWAEDEIYELSLADYFQDPDADEITFDVSEIENINTKINDDTLRFTPEKDWYGTREFVITATDSKGASVNSTPITLVVVERKELSLFNIYEALCWHINLALFFLVMFFVLFIVFKKARKTPKMIKTLSKKQKKIKKRA
ncbi:MAG: Ig-like domain-containing protein [Nanoarchaeota archaeon]|nr:hypothetical protein [Nanoarchaeota archaeon]MBU1849556.1 hypothetical protein [Nanoarchaeota archaeon]